MKNEVTPSDELMQEDFIEDMTAALSSLPDFGYSTKKNNEDIKQGIEIIQELDQILKSFLQSQKNYKACFETMMDLLKEAGISRCVDDLITVRRNVRNNVDFARFKPANDDKKALNF